MTRCNVANDSGYTRADKQKKETYMCLYFARGHCSNGAECGYHHRIPTDEDELRIDITHDVFGRERHRNYREDMGGVGSFLRDNRTLYISNIKRSSDMENVVKAHFAEWGEMEHVRVIHDKGLAFVKYKLRTTAEFAKEAMQDQSLDHEEIINVRWSNEDPNPQNKAQEDNQAYLRLAKMAAEKQKQLESQYQYAQEYYGNQSEYNQYSYPITDNQYYQQQQQEGATTTDYSQSSELIENWLKTLELEQYKDSFLSSGYFDMNAISQLDEYGLDAIGVEDIDHRVKLLEAVEIVQQQLPAPVTTDTNTENPDANAYYYYNNNYYGYYNYSVEEQQQQDGNITSDYTNQEKRSADNTLEDSNNNNRTNKKSKKEKDVQNTTSLVQYDSDHD